MESPIATANRESLVLVYYDVKDRSGAERAADAQAPAADREALHELLTGGALPFTFKEDTESVYWALMPTSRVAELAKAIGAELQHPRPETKVVIAWGYGGTTPPFNGTPCFRATPRRRLASSNARNRGFVRARNRCDDRGLRTRVRTTSRGITSDARRFVLIQNSRY